MGLMTYEVPRKLVEDGYGNALAEVRGLNFKDLNILIQRNFENLDRLMTVWDHYQEIAGQDTTGAEESMANMAAFFSDIAMTAPAIVVDVIALGADATEDEDMEAIQKWPMHAQARALAMVYQLSIIDFGGPVKLLGVATRLLRDHAPQVNALLR